MNGRSSQVAISPPRHLDWALAHQLLNVTSTTDYGLISDSETITSAPDTADAETSYTLVAFGKPWPALKHPAYVVALLSAAYILVAVVGVLSNGLVIAVIWRQARMRTVINYFLANLATADILVCVLVLPITLLQNIFTEWWYGAALCKIAPYLQGVAVSASVNTLAAVAVERYLAINRPQSNWMTVRTATSVICVIWLVPVGLFVPWLLVYRQKHYSVAGFEYIACHAEWRSDTLNRAFTLGVVFITCYLIPLLFIAVCYLLIGLKVRRRRVLGLSRGSRAERNITRTKARVVRMLVVVFVVFALSWLPLYAVGLRLLFDGGDSGGLWQLTMDERRLLKRHVMPVAQWLGASNSCVNPFIYCYFSVSFRLAIRQLLGRTPTESATGPELELIPPVAAPPPPHAERRTTPIVEVR